MSLSEVFILVFLVVPFVADTVVYVDQNTMNKRC